MATILRPILPVPPRVKPSYQRTRDTGSFAASSTFVKGGAKVGIVSYTGGPYASSAAGTGKFMEDFTGPYAKYSTHRRPMIERAMMSRTLVWSPLEVTDSTRYYQGTPSGPWETITGQPISLIFGNMIQPGSNAGGYIPGLPGVDPVIQSRLLNQVSQDCWKSVDPSQSLTLVSALEAHKTMRLLNSKGKGLVDLIYAARAGSKQFNEKLTQLTGVDVRRQPLPKKVLLWDPEGNPIVSRRGKPLYRYGRYAWKDRSDVLTQAATRLLEYRYGWAIVVKEIVDSLKAFHAEAQRNDLLLKYGREYQVTRKQGVASYVKESPLSGVFGGITYQGTQTETTSIKTRAWIRWKLKESELFRKLNDFGLFDIAQTTWDVIPYSFVLDMLADVSGYLQAVDAYMKVNTLSSGWTTEVTQTVTRKVTASNSMSYGWPPIVAYGSSDNLTVTTKTRTINLSLPTHPTVQVKLNLYNVATLAALLKTGASEARQLRV